MALSAFRRSGDSESRSTFLTSKRRNKWYIGLGAFSILLFFLLTTAHFRSSRRPPRFEYPIDNFPTETTQALQVPHLVKPDNVTIVAFVFFGRKSRVEMLRCYLERNLVDAGGWIDEVQWIKNTAKEDDLAYLDEILKTSPRYKMVDLAKEGNVGFVGYAAAWGHVERGKLYVKIDDDVVCSSYLTTVLEVSNNVIEC